MQTRFDAMKKFVLLPLFVLSAFVFPSAVSAADVVVSVGARVTAPNGLPLPVQRRMESSVQAIGEQLMLGMSVDRLIAEKAGKEQIIREVFDKVLVGYGVESVRIQTGDEVCVDVRLSPWNDVIRSVDVVVNVEGMAPEVEKIVLRDIEGAEKVFDDALLGLPLAATDWTQGVLKRSINEFMAERLPEFRADFELSPTENATVRLMVYPRLPVVRTTDLSMRSDTVLNLAMLGPREFMHERINVLIGVPVGFVARHEDEFAQSFADALDAEKDFRHLGLKSKVAMETAENLKVMCRSDTQKYRLRLEGWLDVGRDDDNDLNFRFHVGKRLSRRDEAFVLMDFAPQDVRSAWALGYSRDVSSKATLNARYDFKGRHGVFGGEQKFLNDFTLRYEYSRFAKHGEWGLRYRLHDFLSVEYIVGRDENWLRFIGNF